MNVNLRKTFRDHFSYTDKEACPARRGGKHHSYGRAYDLILSAQRHILDRPLSLLEIGTNNGGSAIVFLHLGSDHLSKFVTLDCKDKRRRAYKIRMKQDERCHHHIMDAYQESTVDFLSANYEKFDIIIDDGPHTWESQKFFFENYYKLLGDDGVLVCEDVKYIYLPEIKKLRDKKGLNLYILDLHHNLKTDIRLDDMLVLGYKD